MAINKKHIENLFRQKFSLKDHKELTKYFENSQLNKDNQEVVKKQWQDFKTNPENKSDLNHVFYKLYYSINQRKNIQQRKNFLHWIPRIAAVLVIGIFIASGIYYFSKNSQSISNQQIVNNNQVEFTSFGGFRNQFKLPDGTSGWLGYNSELTYKVDNNNQRIVNLDGLAFFDVTHNEKQPFIVKTPTELAIRVVGTKFNVASYSEDFSCEVVLEDGKVDLQLNDDIVEEMLPNERVVYDTRGKSMIKSKVGVNDYLAWKEGILVVNGVSLEETCIKIGRFYNVAIDLQTKSLSGHQIRLVLEDESLEEAMDLLCLIFPVKYHIETGKILDNNHYSKKKIIIKNR